MTLLELTNGFSVRIASI